MEEQLTKILVTVLVGLANIIVLRLIPMLFQKITEKAKLSKNSILITALNTVEKSTMDIVCSAKETMVKELLAKSEDGKLSIKDAKLIKDLVISDVKKITDKTTEKVLKKANIDIHTLISSYVEKSVRELKDYGAGSLNGFESKIVN